MVTIHQAAVALLILQIYVSAAPSDTTTPADIAKVENEGPKLDDAPSVIEHSKDENLPENQRQKRFYNPFGFPPFGPPVPPFSNFNKRDQASDLGLYGIDDPLSQIHRHLQEIASVARQPVPPPPPPPVNFPFYFPVIFVPQLGCDCSSNNPARPTIQPDTSRPTSKPPVEGGTTSPDIVNRWPDMEDERQNWGLVINETEADYDGEDFSRPISFDPIVSNTNNMRPAPPVEHGSSQGGSGNGGQSTTTAMPMRPNNNRPSSAGKAPSPPSAANVPPAASPGYPSSSAGAPTEGPTTCDGAVLSCCHQPQVTYDCFSILGCPDPTSYGNPCDPLVILKVIEKYQKFYGVRNG